MHTGTSACMHKYTGTYRTMQAQIATPLVMRLRKSQGEIQGTKRGEINPRCLRARGQCPGAPCSRHLFSPRLYLIFPSHFQSSPVQLKERRDAGPQAFPVRYEAFAATMANHFGALVHACGRAERGSGAAPVRGPCASTMARPSTVQSMISVASAASSPRIRWGSAEANLATRIAG